MLRDRVTDEEISRIVARWTGIPVAKLMEGEKEKLLRLEDTLHERVIGQDEAVKAVAEAILRSRAGIADAGKPIGSFLFLGPTGVGKTELAKTLARSLFDDEKNMIRIDMSEYMEKYSVSRLLGAPPGYVGYDEGGQLTEAVRRKPYSVILFDEVEKAHPDVFNVLLQVLDDGRLTDNKGRVVNFKNTIIIMTSNLGSQLIRENCEALTDSNREEVLNRTKNEVFELLKQTIRPEFLNRIDELIMFTPLQQSEIRDIVDLQIKHVQKLLERNGVQLEVTSEAVDLFAHEGYDPQFGARPVKRVLQRRLLNELSKQIIAGSVDTEKQVVIDARDGDIIFENR